MSTALEVGQNNFDTEVVNSQTPVLVDFWASWCGPCRMLAPTVDQIAQEFAGRMKVVKVNVDNEPALASRYGIRGIPALLLFKGGQVVDQIVGAQPKAAIVDRLNHVLAAR